MYVLLLAAVCQDTHVSLGWRQAELDEADLGLLQAGHAAAGHLLGQNQPLHQLTVIDGASETRHTHTNRDMRPGDGVSEDPRT